MDLRKTKYVVNEEKENNIVSACMKMFIVGSRRCG
jgi:hypothetical protein